jgi:DNA-binding NtrC family response regulator
MSAPYKILIVEDDPAMQATLAQALQRDDYRLFLAESHEEGKRFFVTENPQVVLLDLNLPDRSGRELFDVLKSQSEEVVIIILTAFPDLRGAITLMKAGAFDYLVKPFDLTELKITIQKGLEINRLKNEVMRLKRKEPHTVGVEDFIGESPATRRLREDIVRIAETGNSTVLISGESGTGKELVANAIHAHSLRSRGPLVAINCSAIPENLVESELFGHEKGSFTGADSTSKGVFELADGGTLFLDEVGELPLAVQPKLLRALEERRIKRVGGSREIPVDIRLVSATNRNLSAAVEQGHLREDLFYRLNVVPLAIPPLRERPEDVELLARHLSVELAAATGLRPLEFSADALEKLRAYPWPGNVREMRNLIERLIIHYGRREADKTVQSAELPEEIRAAGTVSSQGDGETAPVRSLAEVEREHIAAMMRIFEGNKSEVSRRLGISRNTLKDKLNRYGLSA